MGHTTLFVLQGAGARNISGGREGGGGVGGDGRADGVQDLNRGVPNACRRRDYTARL